MMEYSPMMVVMLWALTPSDAASVAAHVEEVPTPGMTVHQESYFTFNHGKPFLAEQDPLTGAILNLKTTPVVAPTDDYAYDEEDEEPDGVDRKDGPKIYTRNDIIQPSKDPDLHKFLNLPVHYSTSGKFPLISSSYANTKVQGHSASAQSNHRLTATSSTSTVSPSYYPLKTSATTSATSTSTSTTTTTTTTTTPRPSPSTTPTTTTTTTKPPPAYEYEYEYEYDREPESDKRTTTQKILDFFDKDYAFLGASEEEKPMNNSKVEYVMPSSPAKQPGEKEEESMISPNSNLFIPSDYIKPNADEKINETSSNSTHLGNKDSVPQETTLELKKPLNETNLVNTTFHKEQEDSQTKTPEKEEMEKEELQYGMKITTKSDVETTTPKTEPSSTKPPIKEQKVPFFPTIPPDLRENIYGVSSKPTDLPPKPTQSPIETKPTEATTPTIKPTQFHPPLHYVTHDNRPQDLQPKPSGSVENIKPYDPYQRPYLVNSNVPPEMLPPLRPVEPPFHKRPIERPTSDTHNYRPVDTFHYSQTRPQNTRPQNNRPVEGIGNKQPIPNEHQRPPQDLRPHEHQRPQQDSRPHEHQRPQQDSRPHEHQRPQQDLRPHEHQRPQQDLRPHEQHQRPQDLRPHEHHRPSQDMKPHDLQTKPTSPSLQTQRPTDQRPHDNMQRPDVKLPGRPVMSAPPSNRPTDASLLHQSKPYDIVPSYRPDIPQMRPTDAGVQTRPQETLQKPMQQRPVSRPDNRYPPYLPLRPQEVKQEQRPQHIPEYRPLGPRPEEIRPSGIQEFNVALGSRVPEVNKNKPENPTFNNNKYQVQFTQPSKVENHFIKVTPGQENPSYSLQTSFSIGVPPPDEIQGQGSVTSTNAGSSSNKGVGQVLFPDDTEKRPWAHQDEKRPSPVISEVEKYPRPPWESHLKPPLVFNHVKKDPFPHKRPKPARPDLPNILPQFRPNAKIGHAEPHVYLKTPLDTLQPPPLPRPQFLRAEPPHADEEMPAHRRNGQTTRVVPIQPIIQNPKRGSLRSEDEKADPVFVVYPSNNAQDGVVVGTRGPQRPLPPDNLDMEDSFPLDTNKNFQARVDTPILKVKPTKPVIKNEFPYPLVKPTEVEEKAVTTVTKEYTAFSPTVPPTEKEKEHDTEINIIPYLQDYMPFATKKPSQDVPKWNVGDDIKPISATLKTQKVEETTIKMDNHKTGETPTPQDFQAPFHASLSAPSQGWSVVRPRPEPEKEEETTTAKITEEQEGKFDIQNFKPQLFGGFKPIIPPIDDKELPDHEKEVE